MIPAIAALNISILKKYASILSSSPLSQSCFLQPFSRIGTGGNNTLNLVYKESSVGKMHVHKLCR